MQNECICNELLNIDGSLIGYSFTRIYKKLAKLVKIYSTRESVLYLKLPLDISYCIYSMRKSVSSLSV